MRFVPMVSTHGDIEEFWMKVDLAPDIVTTRWMVGGAELGTSKRVQLHGLAARVAWFGEAEHFAWVQSLLPSLILTYAGVRPLLETAPRALAKDAPFTGGAEGFVALPCELEIGDGLGATLELRQEIISPYAVRARVEVAALVGDPGGWVDDRHSLADVIRGAVGRYLRWAA